MNGPKHAMAVSAGLVVLLLGGFEARAGSRAAGPAAFGRAAAAKAVPLAVAGAPAAQAAAKRGAPNVPPEPCFHGGDVNDDGQLSSGDAQAAFLFAIGLQEPTVAEACASDCNGDGYLSSGDAQAIFFESLGLGSCPYDLPDGELCENGFECRSDHCQNGVCCAGGDCCREVADCGDAYAHELRCDDPATCQGSSGAAACVNAVCTTIASPDDSACYAELLADECGPYPPIYCTGEIEQQVACATSCASDDDCDFETAHCSGGVCVPILFVFGTVRAGGQGVVDAVVTIGSARTTTYSEGSYQLYLDLNDLKARPDGLVFAVEVRAPGFAPGYLNIPYVADAPLYWLDVTLMPQLHAVHIVDNGAGGVTASFDQGGQQVAELTIPSTSLPPGVTLVAGKVAHVDPTTGDRRAFPGGDYLAVPAGGGLVTLESFGVMNFELLNQWGEPVTELAGPATLCMRVPAGLPATVGATVPLWYYDAEAALWQQDGFGTVEERGDGHYLCGETDHFSWWNYDQPITTHACFKYRFVDEIAGEPIIGLAFQAEGVAYAGGAIERPCACDGDDASPPCPGQGMSSFTVKRATPSEPADVRVFISIMGQTLYLVDDGDGTFSLTTDVANATVFAAPEAAGSCLANVSVENCAFLDGEDGILPLAEPNLAPFIYDFYAENNVLPASSTTTIYAWASDINGDEIVQGFATADCGTLSDESFDGTWYSVTYTAPETLGICRVTLHMVDEFGSTSSAWIALGVFDAPPYGVLGGRLIDPTGTDVTDSTVRLSGENRCTAESYDATVTVAADGRFSFTGVPCCALCTEGEWMYLAGFGGTFEVNFERPGLQWTGFDSGVYNCCSSMPWSEICPHDIYLPPAWGTLEGAANLADGSLDTSIDTVNVYIYGTSPVKDTALRELTGTGPAVAGSYSVSVPMLPGSLELGVANWYSRDFDLAYQGETRAFDLGEGALGTVSGTVFDPAAVGSTVWLYCDYAWEWPATVVENGQYEFEDVPVGYCSVYAEVNGYWGYGWLHAKTQVLTLDIGGTGATLNGQVLDDAGVPVAGASVDLSVYGGAYFASTVLSGADGSFVFTDVPTGSGELYVSYGDGDDKAEGDPGWAYRPIEIPEANQGYTYDVVLQSSVSDCWERAGGATK